MDDMFETEHLIIRRFKIEDTQDLYRHHREEAVRKWIPNESYADMEEARDAIAFFIDCVNRKALPFVLAVVHKETGEWIGDTGINAVAGNAKEVEIGYVIARQHRGKGYATELLGAMMKFAASTFGIHVLYGRVLRGNHGSVKVLEKNGFVLVAEEQGAKDDPYGRGILVYRADTAL